MSDFHYVRTLGPDGGVDAAEGSAIGLDLGSVLDGGLPPVGVAVQIVSAVAEILAIAEEDRVTHGDLDLEHVFLDDTGAVSVEGFGNTKTSAPEGRSVGSATDRFGLGALAFALFSPRDLPELPDTEEAYENAVIDAVLGLNFDGIPDDLISDLQWYIVRLLAYDPAERPSALEVWRAFGTMGDDIEGPDFSTWCNDALDGGGERRDAEQASRPMTRPLKSDYDHMSVTGGPMAPQASGGPLARGAVNFEDAGSDKGRSTAYWTRQGMKQALAKVMSSDYIEMDADSEWMPGTPIPPMDRHTSPGGQRWSGPAPVPKRAPGEGRQRAERRTSPPSPLPAPPRSTRSATPSPAPPSRSAGTPSPSQRVAPTPAPPVGRGAPTPSSLPPAVERVTPGLGVDPQLSWSAPADAKTEVGGGLPTNRLTPKSKPTFQPEVDSPTVPAPVSVARAAPTTRPRRGPSAPTPEPLPDPDTSPEFVERPIAPNAPVRAESWSPPAEVEPWSGPSAEPLTARGAAAAISPAADRELSVEPPLPARSTGPLEVPDLSGGPDPFAEAEPEGPPLVMLGAIGLVVMVAVVFCVGVGGLGGAAALIGLPGTASAPVAQPGQVARAPSRPSPASRADEPSPRRPPVSTTAGPSPGPRAPSPSPRDPDPAAAPDAPSPRQVAESAPSSRLPASGEPTASPAPARLPVAAPSPSPAPRPSPAMTRPSPSPVAPTPRPDPLAAFTPEPTPRPDPLAAFQPEPAPSMVRPSTAPVAPGTRMLPVYPTTEQAGDSILPFLVPEPAPKVDGSGPSAIQSHMRQHLTAATAARNAVINGDPDKAREAAQGLEFINPPEALPPNWLPYLVDLRMEAWLMSNSPDIAAAGFKVAQIGQSCATCHEGVRAGPTVTPQAVPAKAFVEKDVMKRHAWAVDWMWIGLIANDQAAWTKGATVLAESPFPSVIFQDFPDQRFMDLEDKLHAFAMEGQTATAPDKRALVFGKLLATCARCHAVYRERKP